jgi:Xaa-Pro aminopeptidase
MSEAGVSGFLVPRADAHQGETVPPRDERLAWLTGFTGSAGLAVVTAERAALFVDSRYTLQARAEVDGDIFTRLRHPEEKPADWLAEVLPAGARIGFDPWLHTVGEIETLREALTPHGLDLAGVPNLVDAVWDDQPAAPTAPIRPHSEALAGRSAADKRETLAEDLRDAGLASAVITAPESIAWLLNVRGGDVARTPVPLAFAVLHADARVVLFAEPAKIGPDLRAHLGNAVALHSPDDLQPHLASLSGRVSLDKARTPVWIAEQLAAAPEAETIWRTDPCILPKACKTPAELEGARTAHHRDGAAMVRFLAWLDRTAPSGGLSEIDVVRRLEEIRSATGALRDIAFETICGAGPNGAIVHYRVNEATNRAIAPGDLLLVDSGGQYDDGTTDITRTIATGPVPEDARRRFTLVLRGLIAMSRLRWPEGLAGRDIDAVARTALWQAGLDYDHGTGHGVGSYLGVHEGPQGLSRRAVEPIRAGMILSIEPGNYREGAYGIRIENLALVLPSEVPRGGERPMHGFETLTLAPIDRRLIDVDLLDPTERAWLDAYHARVASEIGPHIDADAADWLTAACQPLAAGR